MCLGSTAAPFADPVELQVTRLAKKAAAGACFLITQPVFDLDRFEAWFKEVTSRGIHEKVAILAGVEPLPDAAEARTLAQRRPRPMIPEAVLERLASASGQDAQRAEAVKIALETVERLSALGGLRGFQICGDADPGLAVEIIEKAGLGTD